MSENMVGKIVQVMGPVIDVDFESYLPAINEALEIDFDIDGQNHKLILEVAAHIGDNRIRAIAMDMTEGLTRGEKVIAKGNPISVPVGEQVLGRIFNVIGDVIDGGEELKNPERWSIHRAAPSFENQSTKTETGLIVKEVHGDLYDKPFSTLVLSCNNHLLTANLFVVQGIEASVQLYRRS